MNPLARRIQLTYLVLLLGNTLAASFIWGINTLFLLDAGLSNLEAFAANAFFTAGMVISEATSLGVPFLLRVGVLVAMLVIAWLLMHDLGFEPEPARHPLRAAHAVFDASLEHG